MQILHQPPWRFSGPCAHNIIALRPVLEESALVPHEDQNSSAASQSAHNKLLPAGCVELVASHDAFRHLTHGFIELPGHNANSALFAQVGGSRLIKDPMKLMPSDMLQAPGANLAVYSTEKGQGHVNKDIMMALRGRKGVGAGPAHTFRIRRQDAY